MDDQINTVTWLGWWTNGKTTMNWYRWTGRTHIHTWLCLKMVQHRQCNESRYNICQTKYAPIHEMECKNRHSETLSLSLFLVFTRFHSSCMLSKLLCSVSLLVPLFLHLFSGCTLASETQHTHAHIRKAFQDITSDIKHCQCRTFTKPAAHLFSWNVQQKVDDMWSNNENKRKERKQASKKAATKSSSHEKRNQSSPNEEWMQGT